MSRKTRLPARVLEFARERALLGRGDRVLAAVSGGADSMVLLRCLLEVRGALDLSIAIGHVDHSIRADSAEDAAFVASEAARLGLPCAVRRTDVRGVARARGATLEEAGREVRGALLLDMARDAGARVVATGHTATDQAETVLMRILRGTGPAGLAGIAPHRPDGFVRPLLCATRAEVRAFAAAHEVAFREDPTNRDERHLRNRVRLRVLPLLLECNPRAEHALCALAEDAGALGARVAADADALVEGGEGEARVGRAAIRGCGGLMLPYVVRAAFERATGAPLGLSRTHLDAVVRLVASGAGGEVHLPRGVVARTGRAGLVLRRGPGPRRGPAGRRSG